MAIKDLLVAFDGNDASLSAVSFAVQMAKKYDASITGIHVFQHEKYESHVRRWIPKEVLANVREAEMTVEKSIEESFNDQIKASGFKGDAKWIAREGKPGTLLPRFARYFDIMITGQFANVDETGGSNLNAEELLMRSGKPIITVPTAYEAKPFSETAAVAWDGSRSAARALTDAMQILETKSRLDVIRLVGGEEDEARRVLPEHDLIAHLEAHGINANLVQLKSGRMAAGRTILDHCIETQPDILVMGAYGRGRIGTIIFGSTAQYVLKHMALPVLMSH